MTRGIWIGVAFGALAVVALACRLEPDPRGFGTHTQLGLPPCGFRAWIGLGCPTCGLTTSFAHMARLQFTSALHAHALGPALFLLDLIAIPVALFAAVRALPVAVMFRRLRASTLAVIIAVAAVLHWIARSIA